MALLQEMTRTIRNINNITAKVCMVEKQYHNEEHLRESSCSTNTKVKDVRYSGYITVKGSRI